MVFDPPIAGNAFSQQIGFGSEAFYWVATAVIPLPSGGRALIEFGLEAAFNSASGEAENGQQIVFSRTRIRIDAPSIGTYTVFHPWGQRSFDVTVVEPRNINFTADIGAAVGNPGAAIDGEFGPFLVQVDPVPTAGWLGDGNVLPAPDANGVDGALVTGGTVRNTVRIEGPNIGGPGVNFIETARWTVNALQFQGTPFRITRSTFSRDAGGATFAEVFAHTPAPPLPGIALTATLSGQGPLPLTRRGNLFFGRIPFNTPVLPSQVTVTGTLNANPNTITELQGDLVDTILITKAEYSVGAKTLTVAAISSDAQAVLRGFNWVGATAAGQPIAAAGADTVFSVPWPPINVSVRSALGGAQSVRAIILP
jgi:hypothetical protein